MQLMTAAESWRAIRTMRAEPQGRLGAVLMGDISRRREFHMALEQAQQQFAAAARIGYESRPLNLFYGLSQAGRAVAAGSYRLGRGTGHQWQASGHGLKYDVAAPAGVLATPIKQDGGTRDLFSRASIATGSPLDFGEVEFGALINQLVDYTMVFRETEGYSRPIHDVHVYASSQVFPLELEVHIPSLPRGNQTTPAEVRELLSVYPALRDLPIAQGEDGRVRWSHNEGRCFVVVENADRLVSRVATSGVWELKGYTDYRRSAVLLPTSGNSEEPLRPLMSWWGVLYALSMLARYAPGRWTETLSLSESAIASRVEFLLDAAVEAVPELLWSEFFALQGPQHEPDAEAVG
jgi:hypothetical protein